MPRQFTSSCKFFIEFVKATVRIATENPVMARAPLSLSEFTSTSIRSFENYPWEDVLFVAGAIDKMGLPTSPFHR